jgi:hypothetical protein
MKTNDYYELVIAPILDEKSNIGLALQREIIDFSFVTFITHKEKLVCLHGGKVKTLDKSKQAFQDLAYSIFIKKFKGIKLKKFNEDKFKYEWDFNIDMLYYALKNYNHYEFYKYTTNLFNKECEIELDEERQEVTVINNKILIKSPRGLKHISIGQVIEIMEDYQAHFSALDEVLKLIVDMRVAQERKRSYLHIRANSNWGKSFFSSILCELNLGVELDYSNFIKTDSSSVSPQQLRDSSVLILDEFTEFHPDMKRYTHQFSFAPKFGMKETVEVYLKILFSADRSESFIGIVDDQILNRVLALDLSKNKIPLTERKILVKHGLNTYRAVVAKYIYKTIKKHILEYQDMEEFEAVNKANNAVFEVYKKWSLVDNEDVIPSSIVDSAQEIVKEEIHNMITNYTYRQISDMPQSMKQIGDAVISIQAGIHANRVLIRRPFKVIMIILKNALTPNAFERYRATIKQVSDIYPTVHGTQLKIKGSRFTGVIVDNPYHGVETLVHDSEDFVSKIDDIYPYQPNNSNLNA